MKNHQIMNQTENYNVQLLTEKEYHNINAGQYCWGCAVGRWIRNAVNAYADRGVHTQYGL